MKVGTGVGRHVTRSLSEIGNFKSHHPFFPQPSPLPFPTSLLPWPVPTTKPQEIRQVIVHCSVLMMKLYLGTLCILMAPLNIVRLSPS